MATDRIIINSDVAPAFIAALKNALALISDSASSSPTLVSTASKARVKAMISSAIACGAHLIHGPSEIENAENKDEPGIRLAPVILGGATESMNIWQDEAFASLAACMIAEDDDEAVRIANRGGYGLSAAIFTEDLRRGLSLARKIETG